jgi:excisionase family DNA binding protein
MSIHENIQFDKLLKPTDVARILNISRALSYRLLQKGEIPVIRVNNAIRVKPNDLEDFIEKSRNSQLNEAYKTN